jgi:hypothetical protein
LQGVLGAFGAGKKSTSAADQKVGMKLDGLSSHARLVAIYPACWFQGINNYPRSFLNQVFEDII